MNEELFMQELARALRQQCNARFRNQRELAIDANLNPCHLSEILSTNGKRQRITTLLRLCMSLRIPPWRILRNAWGPLYDFETGKALKAQPPQRKKKP